MTVYETDIPGVGRKFELEVGDAGGSRIVVLLHHDGRREVFRRPGPEADSERLFDLDARTARRLGSILTGTNFETVDVAALEVPLGEAIIEWWSIDAGSGLAGATLEEAAVRETTGVSVIAIQRGEMTMPNPDGTYRIEPGDVLVTLGTRAQQAAFEDLA